MQRKDGSKVKFVALPELAPSRTGNTFARPDEPSDVPSLSWRQRLEQYNASGKNPLGLLPAYRLYSHPAYEKLASTFGVNNVRILSAGWGLVRADYLLPDYDITFSRARNVQAYKRRTNDVLYDDFMQIEPGGRSPVTFLGGKDYVPVFKKLVAGLKVDKTIMFRSAPEDTAREWQDSGFVMKPFRTSVLTNWHYACANAICNGF